MKYEVQISRLAVFCVLCTTAFSGAFGAASVRSLGGTGTYSGTSAAASGGSTSSTAARAGSLRVAPTAGGTASATTTSRPAASTGRIATTPRLSIGKYLGSGTSISGGSSIKNQKPGGVSVSAGGTSSGGSTDLGTMAAIEGRVSHLENNTYDKKDVDAALKDKQNILVSADEYIVIDPTHDEIYLDVEKLQGDLEVGAGQDGREVQIGTNDTGIYWQYADDDTTRESLIAWEDLRGEDGKDGTVDADELNAAVEAAVATATEQFVSSSDLETKLADYATEEVVSNAINAATADLVTQQDLADAVIDASNIDLTDYAKTSDVNTALAAKANAGASYTKDESDSKYLTEHQSLENLATKEELASAVTSAVSEAKTEIQGDVTNVVNTAVTEKIDAVQITNAQVANDAEIARSKLATDVQNSLDTADKALNGADPEKIQMLGSINGEPTWLDII